MRALRQLLSPAAYVPLAERATGAHTRSRSASAASATASATGEVARAMDAEEKKRIQDAIAALRAAGETASAAGVQAIIDQIEEDQAQDPPPNG
ncbi:hypothetical protein GCM10027436_87980 [Actinophytocola sediminis]